MGVSAPPLADRAAGKYERLAWERHERDLALAYPDGEVPMDPELARTSTQHPKGFWFDPEDAIRPITFFQEFCRHSKGEWRGQLIVLEDWQQRILGIVFGWKRADGTRRFRIAYIEIARKNSKSTMGAGVGLYLTAADDEPGAEVYSSAPLALTTPIPTPSGWTTMADVRAGDMVFDDCGRPTKVISTSPVFQERVCYALTFEGGERIVADAEHRWAVQSVAVGSLAGIPKTAWRKRAVNAEVQVLTTALLAATVNTNWGARNHRVALGGALELPDAVLPIAPYVLGLWLGDGRQSRGALVCHPSDAEVLDYIRAEGYDVSVHGENALDGLLHFTILGLRTQLRLNGLLENKFVPPAYLRGSIAQRRALLQGLMDTDGTCTKTSECRFTNRNRNLAESVHELATSLGFRASLRVVEVLGSPHYIVSFKAWQGNSAFRLERKRRRQLATQPLKCRYRKVISVDPVPSVPVRCIGVAASSSLFLAGRAMVPTHNTKKDQAKIVHDSAVAMVQASPELKRDIRTYRNNLHVPELGAKFEPLGADSSTLDGLSPHGNIIDELHAHRDRTLWDVMDTAMGARRQPLTWAITTAGLFDPESIGWLQHEHAMKVLEGVLDDDEFFGIIFAADEDDDWQDPSTWEKANPNLGVSVKRDYLAGQCKKAQQQSSFLNTFLRLHLGRWTQQRDRWLSIEQWNACDAQLTAAEYFARFDALAGAACFGGLDLSSKLDMSAIALVFPATWDILLRYYVPEETVHQRVSRDRVPYDAWIRDGWVIATPGNTIDYDFIEKDILGDEEKGTRGLADRFDLREFAFDPWNATQIVTHLLGQGLPMVEVQQGYKSLSDASKEFEALIVKGKIRHGGHPVMRWNVSNVATREDVNGNIAPDKGASGGGGTKAAQRNRIDGVSATITALSRVVRHEAEDESMYTDGMPWV